MEITASADVLEGARKILKGCLSTRAGDIVALFYDGTTRDVASVIRSAARELDLTLVERFVSVSDQIRSKGKPYPEDLEVMNAARAILTCISNNPRSTKYRRGLVKNGTNFDNFFGHIPGANLELLAHASKIDLGEAVARCDDLAVALARSKQGLLRTFDFDSSGNPVREHILHLTFADGRLPITSTGIIPRGTWGNIPGGETFIAPEEGSCHGSYALNGSFLNTVIPPANSIHLKFENGKLVSYEGSGHAHTSFRKLLDWAKTNGGAEYNQLAELGIGVNSGISKLTGRPLLDEKCVGTAHIAIGDNTRYGGDNESGIHEDLITWKPSLELDGQPILEFGNDVLDLAHWRESIYDPGITSQGWTSDLYLQIGATAESHNGTSLVLNQEVAAGRSCRYTIGDKISSPLLSALYRMLPNSLFTIQKRAQETLGLTPDITSRGMVILEAHGLVRVQRVGA